MTNPNLTHVYFLLDRSGSMSSIRTDIEGGFGAFVDDQRRQPGECRVTLAQFDDRYEEVYRDVPVADVPPLQLQPRGMTALLDSIGRLIGEAGARLAGLPEHERPGLVVFGIMTDGLENASREMTHTRVRELIARQTKDYSWQFLYLGADQDAIEVGRSIGLAGARAMTYDRQHVGAALASMSGNIGRARSMTAAGSFSGAELDWDEEQRTGATT